MKSLKPLYHIILALSLFTCLNAQGAHHHFTLNVHYKTLQFSNKKAIALNNQIPAPTLRFKEGDTISLTVHNHLDKETAIHWHGLILPWQMDGVKGVSQQGIPPGGSFKYHFTLRQSGTYWYHAHAGLQEQEGLYGALIIDPVNPPKYKYNKDYVIVLSDWSNTPAEQILANLKKKAAITALIFLYNLVFLNF